MDGGIKGYSKICPGKSSHQPRVIAMVAIAFAEIKRIVAVLVSTGRSSERGMKTHGWYRFLSSAAWELSLRRLEPPMLFLS